MTPEYLEALADIADPNQLWRHPPLERHTLTEQQKHQLDMGVALRRHAHDRRELIRALEQKRSVLITPLSTSSCARKTVDTPDDHERLRPALTENIHG